MKEVLPRQVKHPRRATLAAQGFVAAVDEEPFCCKGFCVDALPDGKYESLVVDASRDDDGTVRVELVVVSGERKGDVVALRAAQLARDPVDLLGLPATLAVRGGIPSVELG
jgi:hypothetical protein